MTRSSNAPYDPQYFPLLITGIWARLLARFLRFCEHVTIDSKDEGPVRLYLRPSQRYFIEEVFAGFAVGLHDFVVTKGRQLGISTVLWAFELFWLTRFSLQAMHVTDDEPNKEIHRDIVQGMYLSLPRHLSRGAPRVANRLELAWHNTRNPQTGKVWRASRLMWAFANRQKTGQLGRSRGANFILGDELDSWGDKDAPASLDAARSSTHPYRAYFWVGTGQGYTLLYSLWEQAQDSTSSKAIFVGWWRDPERVVTRDERAKWAVYGQPAPTQEETEWGDEVFRRYEVRVSRQQLAWWRWTLAEGKGINGDVAKMMQEHPWCLSGGTRVSTTRGIIPLAEAVAGDVTESGEALGVYPQGVRDVVLATTRDGRILVGTSDHPMEAPDGSIVRLGESRGHLLPLRAPRFAAELYRLRWELFGGVQCEMTVDEAWGRFLGYFAGDGCFHNGYLSITCDAKDTDVVEDATALMVRLFGGAHPRLVGRRRGNPDRLGWVEVRRGCAEFPALARRLGIWKDDKPHRRVCVPEAIFRSPQSVVREFLRGLFEADGFNAYHARSVALFSKWPAFLRDIQILLLGFGITSRIRPQVRVLRGQAHGGAMLRLRSREAALFNECVGFIGVRKRSRDDHKPFDTHPSLPIEMTDEVLSVEPATAEMVYDITIAQRHTFSANGLVSHNCPEQSFQASGSEFLSPQTCLHVRRRLMQAPAALHYRYDWGPYFDSKADPLEIIESERGRATKPERRPELATLTMWEPPQRDHVYVLAGDPAYGSGPEADRFAATVWRCHPDAMVQAAEYATPLGAMYQYAWVLAHLAGAYRIDADDHLILEIGGPGRAVHEELERMASYAFGLTPATVRALTPEERMRGPHCAEPTCRERATVMDRTREIPLCGRHAALLRKSADDITAVLSGIQHFLYRRIDSITGQQAWHFNTTTENRIQIFEQLRDTVERGALVVRSPMLAEELAALRREDSGRIEAGGIAKDDLAFTAALAVHCWLQNVVPEIEDRIAPLVTPRDAPEHAGEAMLRRFVRGLDRQAPSVAGPMPYGLPRIGPGRGRR